MIKQISWETYCTFLAITTALYYVVVCIRFYSGDIKRILEGKSIFSFARRVKNNKSISKSEQELFPIINYLFQEIKMFLESASEQNMQRQDIIYAFQLILNKYPALKNSSLENIVTNHIINECSNYCSVHLKGEELNQLWVNQVDGAF